MSCNVLQGFIHFQQRMAALQQPGRAEIWRCSQVGCRGFPCPCCKGHPGKLNFVCCTALTWLDDPFSTWKVERCGKWIQEELLACLLACVLACLLAQVMQLICVLHFHCNLPRLVHKWGFVCFGCWLTCLFLCFADSPCLLAWLLDCLFGYLLAFAAVRVLTGLLCCLMFCCLVAGQFLI